MADNQYRRLTWPRRRKVAFVALTYIRSSLWLSNDHLLGLDSNGYSETYKRFYFHDIQAITVRLTRRRLVWNWVLIVPTAICLAIWARALMDAGRQALSMIILWAAVTLLFAIPLLLNNLFGPTCSCTLRTAVQTEELPSLNRLPKARRVLNILRPLIAQAQGQLVPEELHARLQAGAEPTAAASNAAATEPRYVVDDPSAPPRIVS